VAAYAQPTNPTITSVTPSNIPATNPSTLTQPPPYSLIFSGTQFLSTATVTFTWTGNSGGTSGAVHWVSSTSLLAKVPPGIPSGLTSITAALCNSPGVCAAPQTIFFSSLQNSTGALGATPNPASAAQPVTLKATFSGAPGASGAIGAPTGTVTFKNGATTLGTGKLILDTASGAFTATSPTNTSAPPTTPGMRLVDMNGDGIPDLVFVDSNVTIHVLLGTTAFGNFQPEITQTVNASCATLNSFDVGDLNGDGYPDVVVDCSNGSGTIILNILPGNGDGTFGSATTLAAFYGKLVAIKDINKDGFPDLISAGNISNCVGAGCQEGIAAFTNNGTGVFTKAFSNTATDGQLIGTQVMLADMDGDGYPDLVALNNTSISVYRNHNGTSFGTLSGGLYGAEGGISLGFPPTSYSGLFIADFNNDGLPDLGAVLSGSGTGITTVINTSKPGTFTFAAPSTFTIPAAGISATTGDFNGDGNQDIAVVTATGATVYDGNGAGVFSTNYSGLTTPVGSTVLNGVAGDMDADGDADIVLATTQTFSVAVVFQATSYITIGSANATLVTSIPASGTAPLTAAWPGNINFLASTGNLSLPVNTNATTTLLGTSGSPTEFGQPVTFTATITSSATGTPTGTVTFYDGGTTNLGASTLIGGAAGLSIATLTAGTHTITAVYSGDTVFTASTSGNLSQVVTQAQPTVSWTPLPATITYGTALSAAQLDAKASSKYVANVAGTFNYTPASGAVLAAGNQTLNVTFTPTDTADFKTATGTTSITVSKVTPTVSWTAPSPITYGTALSGTQLNATATGISGALPGSFVYTPAAGTVLGAGANQPLSVTFTPTDTTDYNNATGNTTITVGKATPTINWTTPSAITYGTALSATQLNATATSALGAIPGAFVYTPAAGTVLAAGAGQALSVSFTPTDTTDYNNAAGGTTITVNKATPTINWATPSSISYGTALSATQLNATATGISGALPGNFIYTPTAGTVLTAGSQNLSVSFTPTDTADYNSATGGTTITVGKASPTVSWVTPSPIIVGTPLSATQLNATATGVAGALAGSFVYTPPAGTVLAAGNNQALGVVFTPTDTTDYVTANGSTTITVIALALTSIAPSSATLGDPNKTVTLTGTGFLANSVVNVNGIALATTFVSATTVTAVIPASYFQTIQTLSITVFDPTQNQTSSAISLPVTPSIPSVVFTGPGTTQPSQQPSLTFTLTNPYPVALNATLTLTFAGTGGADDPAIQFATGGRTYTFTIPANTTQTPTIQIQSGTDAGTVTVTLALSAAGQNVTPPALQPVIITIPPVAPVITSATLTRTGDTITVSNIGFSDTREVSSAGFHFVASAGNTINDPDFTVPATALFSTWFSTAGSQAYGSEFTYIQIFSLSSGNSVVGKVTVSLTNSAGTSATATAQ